MNDQLYESPVHIESTSDCNFYHTTDIPGVGVVEGQWDLRDHADEYLGGFDFTEHQVTFNHQRAFNLDHEMFTIVSSRP